MAKDKETLKSRIRSVKSIRKITSAMELVAEAKLGRKRSEMEKNRDYALKLQDMVNSILSETSEDASEFLREHESSKSYNVLFCSDMGLCGSYNSNIMRFAINNLSKDDYLIVFGLNCYDELKSEGFNIVNEKTSIETLDYMTVQKEMNKAIDLYLKDEVSSIKLVYTKFENVMTFNPTINEILPYKKDESKNGYSDLIFEPSVEKVLDKLIVMMIHNVTYALSLESKTSEQASRRNAMESANDNADELVDNLLLQYNQARQAAITQEITEIVSGADAL